MATSSTVVDMSGDEKEAMLRAADNSQKKRESRTNQDEPTYVNICTARCGKVCNPHMIKCDKCEQYTHFSCTEIPGYQLQQLMTKGYRKYLCPNCFELNFGMVDPIYDTIPSQASTCEVEVQTELLNIIREVGTQTEPETPIDTVSKEGTTMLEYHLGLAEEEIAKLKEANDQLSNLLFDEKESLTNEIAKLKEANDQLSKSLTKELSAAKEEISRINECCVKEKNSNRQQSTKLKSLEEENNTLEQKSIHQGRVIQNMKKKLLETEKNDKAEINTEVSDKKYKRLVDEVSRMQAEIVQYELSLKQYEKSETDLKTLAAEQEAELKDQQRKFDEADNPNFNNLTNLETFMKKQFQQIGESIQKSMREEIQANNTLIEKKLADITQPPNDENVNKLYSAAVGSSTNIKHAIREVKNDDKIEESEAEKRAKNIIIHGAEEIGTTSDEIKKEDNGFVKSILDKLGIPTAPASVARLGKANERKRRPIKLVMKCKEDKIKVLKNLNKLKGTEDELGKISITDDYTETEREEIKHWVMKAKEKTVQDPDKVYKVRGDPKNGMRLIWFVKNQ